MGYKAIGRGIEEAAAPTKASPGKTTLIGLLMEVMVAVII
jgi:hypothetical protein